MIFELFAAAQLSTLMCHHDHIVMSLAADWVVLCNTFESGGTMFLQFLLAQLWSPN